MGISVTPADGGWVYVDWETGRAWLRLARDRRNRLTRIAEIRLADPTPELLRRVPLRRIEAALTMRGAGAIQFALAAGFKKEPPASLFDRPPKGIKLERRFKLRRPEGRRLDDAFYRSVAHAYQSAVAFGLQPRKAIVEDTGAADATVAGWVGEARRRGHLPPAQPGKISA